MPIPPTVIFTKYLSLSNDIKAKMKSTCEEGVTVTPEDVEKRSKEILEKYIANIKNKLP